MFQARPLYVFSSEKGAAGLRKPVGGQIKQAGVYGIIDSLNRIDGRIALVDANQIPVFIEIESGLRTELVDRKNLNLTGYAVKIAGLNSILFFLGKGLEQGIQLVALLQNVIGKGRDQLGCGPYGSAFVRLQVILSTVCDENAGLPLAVCCPESIQ